MTLARYSQPSSVGIPVTSLHQARSTSTNVHAFVDHPPGASVVNPVQRVRLRSRGANEAEVRSTGGRCPTFRQYGGQVPMIFGSVPVWLCDRCGRGDADGRGG
jgi:hypothetical protein